MRFGSDFEFEAFLYDMQRHELDIASPSVTGSPWSIMTVNLPSTVAGILTNFVEMQLTALKPDAWKCLHKMLNPVLNPSGWLYDMCIWTLCGEPRIGILNFTAQHLGVGTAVSNGIPTTFTSLPTAEELKRWILWANKTFDGKLPEGIETCRANVASDPRPLK